MSPTLQSSRLVSLGREGGLMVQRTVVVLEDDLDGGEAVETVVFALDGGTYEIDLNEDNAAQMRDKSLPTWGRRGVRVVPLPAGPLRLRPVVALVAARPVAMTPRPFGHGLRPTA